MIEVRNIYEGQDLLGPGWLMFFTNTVQVIDPKGGAARVAPSRRIAKGVFLDQELGLDEDDLSDIIILLTLSGLIE